ncbi:MAG: ATP-binding protein [Endomicrobiales bacterium]|jgi:hypothetical protein
MLITTIYDLLNPQRTMPIHQLLNLWAIEDNCIIGVDGTISAVYELKLLPDLIHLTDGERDSALVSISRSLLTLPVNTTMQLVVEAQHDNSALIDRYCETVKPEPGISARIVREKIASFRKTPSRRSTYFLCISVHHGEIPQSQLYFSKLKDSVIDCHKRRTEISESVSLNLLRDLGSAGIKSERLNKDALVGYIYRHLNPGRPVSCKVRPEETLRSQVAFTAAENAFTRASIGTINCKAVNLYSRPENISIYDVAKFLNRLDVDYKAVFTVHANPEEKLRKSLKMQSTIDKQANFLTPSVRFKAISIDTMLAETEAGHQKLFNYSLSVLLSDTDPDVLNRKAENALSAFRALGDAEGVIEDMNHLYVYLSALPGHSFYNVRLHPFAQDALATMLPLHRQWTGSPDPKMLFLTGGGEIIGLDLFDKELPAKHGLVIGSTGSGKSFTTNYLLANFLTESMRNQVVIIDVGGSYRKLCSLFGGQYIDVRMTAEYAFNPFPQKQYFYQGKDVDPDIISFISLILQKMLKIRTLSGRETSILENAVKCAYRTAKTDPPTLSDIADALRSVKGDTQDRAVGNGFEKDLGPWVSGRYSVLLNNPSPKLVLDPSARLVVFDLQKLIDEPDLGPVMFFVVRSAIQSRLANKDLQKMIVIDEGWQFFNDETGSQLIENLYRTARKFNAMVLSISQSPEDFLKTKAATSIIANSYTKYFLKLTKGHDLLPQFGLTSAETAEVHNLSAVPKKYSEVFLKFLNRCAILRIVPNPLDYWICTTDPRDAKVEDEMQKNNPSLNLTDLVVKLSEEAHQ